MPSRRITALLCGCLFAVLLVGVGGRACKAQPRRSVAAELPRPIVFAHRGGGGEAPESTVLGMQAALARDPQVVIELDVRRSRDGQLVVIHDGTVDRTTNGSGRVAELSYAELAALDAGHCATPGRGRGTASRGDCRDPAQATASRFPLRGKGYRIPLLSEVLTSLPASAVIGIEVKEPGFEQQLVDLLRKSGRPPRLFLGSAHDEVAERLKSLLPEAWYYFPRSAATRLAASVKLSNGRLSRPDYDVLAIPTGAMGLRLDTRGMIGAAHQLGLLVAFFTINDEGIMQTLVERGADAIITDYPGRARKVIDRLKNTGAAPARPPLDMTKPPH